MTYKKYLRYTLNYMKMAHKNALLIKVYYTKKNVNLQFPKDNKI